MYTRVLIKPERDSANTYPETIEFEIDEEGVKMNLNERSLTFSLKDIKKLIRLAEVMEE